jgi:putative transposase
MASGSQHMNPPKADELDYIHFLIAAQNVFTCTEAARCQPNHLDPPAHDAFTRLLSREPPDTEALWAQRNHLELALRAFLRLETNRLERGVSWYEAKLSIVRDAVRRYLAEPLYLLSPTA